ncbi:hypothetical protein C4Q31_13005 [Leptospira borgpetersenii serovar Ceylonica]|nr:hypothetical protein C4Q31_13005 [Leptospira borgpetersenii serovar Ceylonica]
MQCTGTKSQSLVLCFVHKYPDLTIEAYEDNTMMNLFQKLKCVLFFKKNNSELQRFLRILPLCKIVR